MSQEIIKSIVSRYAGEELSELSFLNPLIIERINYIVMFGGAFNPPHINHLITLEQALKSSGQDLNILGAFILPSSTNFLRNKFSQEENPLLLARSLRCELWMKEARRPKYTWVFQPPGLPEHEFEVWRTFLEEIEQASKVENYHIEVIYLHGAETFYEPLFPEWARSEARASINLISDLTRKATWSTDLLQIFTNYSPWKPRYDLWNDQLEIWDSEPVPGMQKSPRRVRLLKSSLSVSPLSSTTIRNLCTDVMNPSFESEMSKYVLSWRHLRADAYFTSWLSNTMKG